MIEDCTIWRGDCLELIRRIDDEVNCIVVDPPYGVDFVSRRAETAEGKKWVKAIEADADLEEALETFARAFTMLADRTADEADAYVFTRWDIVGDWIDLMNELEPITGFKYKMLLVWDKGIPGMGDIDANWGCGHELILYLKRGRRDVAYRRSGIIHVDKVPNTQHVHPTQKPVGLIEVLLEMSTSQGDLVVDPFAGSGSTIVAAQNLYRRGVGIELDEEHARRALSRLEQIALPL